MTADSHSRRQLVDRSRGQAPTHELADAVPAWFARHARDLPWRRRRSGYSALVAEAMLQQTQVARVIEPFQRFMRTFPTVHALAEASEDTVLSHWQGLGYYRRARHLLSAAHAIASEHHGRVPRDTTSLMRLPGVGRYTAGAIASIAYGQAAPIVDGNVERVLMRVHGRVVSNRAWTWARADELVRATGEPGLLNEGLMELGATICTPSPSIPRCEACPIAHLCKAQRLGRQSLTPSPRIRQARRRLHHHAVIVQRSSSDRVLLVQREQRGMWAGMWQTPTVESDAPLRDRDITARLGLALKRPVRRCGTFTHLTTHRCVVFHVFYASYAGRMGVWRSPDETSDLPMSSAHRRVLGYVRT